MYILLLLFFTVTLLLVICFITLRCGEKFPFVTFDEKGDMSVYDPDFQGSDFTV